MIPNHEKCYSSCFMITLDLSTAQVAYIYALTTQHVLVVQSRMGRQQVGHSTPQVLILFGVNGARGHELWAKVNLSNCFTFEFFGPEGRASGNNRVDLPDVPLKDRPHTTSRSEVINFTLNNFFGARSFSLFSRFRTCTRLMKLF